MSMAESVKLWEDLFDDYGDAAAELFIVTLLRDARAEHAAARKEKVDDEEEQRHARVFEPWQPPLPGSALPPLQPAVAAAKRTVVMGLRAPPHLLPPRKHERTQSAPAADLGRSVKPAKKPRVA